MVDRVWLSLGSNIERSHNLRAAVRSLRAVFGQLVLSPVYESQAVGFKGAPFFNMVVGLETDLPPEALADRLRQLESEQGRIRGADKFAPRTLDVDLLIYGDRVINQGSLQLPRDEIVRYAFVLRPLADVAGSEVHPVSGESYQALWAAFDQRSQPLHPVTLLLD